MNLHKQLLVNNDCYKAGTRLNVKGIMVHSTGANNPNLRRYVAPNDGELGVNSNGNHWNTPQPEGKSVCVHAFIGKLANGNIATYQTLPWDIQGWHCGGSANTTHIGFEICEDGLADRNYFNKVYREAVELTAYLCKLYNLNPLADGVIICHSEGATRGIASCHGDIMHWFPKHGKNMDTFRKDVTALLSSNSDTPSPTPIVSNTYKNAITTDSLNIRTSYNTSASIMMTVPKGTKLEIINYPMSGWAQVKPEGSNRVGYCVSEYLQLVPSIELDTKSYVFDNTGKIYQFIVKTNSKKQVYVSSSDKDIVSVTYVSTDIRGQKWQLESKRKGSVKIYVATDGAKTELPVTVK